MGQQYERFDLVEDKIIDIDGLLRDNQEKFLFDIVSSLPEDALIVEIGAFMGKSTICMGMACFGTNRKIFSVDTWDGNRSDFFINDFYLNWSKNVMDAGLEGHVFPLIGDSKIVMPLWKSIAKNRSIDLLFIDGSHVYHDVLADFFNSYPSVKDRGYILFHDITEDGWPGPDQVWRELASNVLSDHIFCSSLGGGRKRGPLPRWADLYCSKMLSTAKV